MCFSLNAATTRVLPQNEQAAEIWNTGGAGYERISRQIADAIEHCVDRLAPEPGQRILDVATGTGWTARRVAARGASVLGVDISDAEIEAARRFDESGKIGFEVADAEALPFADGEFDAVISTFGVMFCGDPARAAAELSRVCKPGGRLALATWEKRGGVFDMFRVIQAHKPPSPASPPSPFDWSNASRLNEWFGDFNLRFERATSFYREPSAEDAWEAFATGYGPVKALAQKLPQPAADAFRRDFLAFHEEHRTGAGILVPRPYLITCANKAM